VGVEGVSKNGRDGRRSVKNRRQVKWRKLREWKKNQGRLDSERRLSECYRGKRGPVKEDVRMQKFSKLCIKGLFPS